MKQLLTADTVAALLAHFPDDEFRCTSAELQAGFREVARSFPQLLGQISFGKVGAYVSAPAVEAALDSLAASGFYSRYNRDLVTYDLDKSKLKSYYDEFLRQRFAEADIPDTVINEASVTLQTAIIDIHGSSNLERLLVTSS